MIRSAVTLLTLLALTSHLQQVSAGRRVQRLVILNRSELKIVPRFEFPVRLRSLRSAFNFQLPIQLRLTNRLNFDLRQRLRSVRSANATDAALDELLGQVRASGRAGFLHGLSTLRPLRWLQPAGNLKDCVRKAICEVSSVPLIHPDYGLFGEIINLLFRSVAAVAAVPKAAATAAVAAVPAVAAFAAVAAVAAVAAA